jgi:hypothetical protein
MEELVLPGVVAVSAVAVLAVFGSALLEEWAEWGRASNNSKGSPRTLQS